MPTDILTALAPAVATTVLATFIVCAVLSILWGEL